VHREVSVAGATEVVSSPTRNGPAGNVVAAKSTAATRYLFMVDRIMHRTKPEGTPSIKWSGSRPHPDSNSRPGRDGEHEAYSDECDERLLVHGTQHFT
jgi:hypothetical protein